MDKNYVIIIEAGTLLTTKIHTQLSNQKALYILKGAAGKQKLNCQNLQFYVESNKDLNEKTMGFIYKVNSKLFAKIVDDEGSSLKISCVESIVKSIIFLIKIHPHKNKYLLFQNLIQKSSLFKHIHINILNVSVFFILLSIKKLFSSRCTKPCILLL